MKDKQTYTPSEIAEFAAARDSAANYIINHMRNRTNRLPEDLKAAQKKYQNAVPENVRAQFDIDLRFQYAIDSWDSPYLRGSSAKFTTEHFRELEKMREGKVGIGLILDC